MAGARKYSFDTVFAPDGAVLHAGGGYRSHYSADEVDALRSAAFEEGRADFRARADSSIADAAAALAQSAALIAQRLNEECALLRAEASALALAAARKAAGAALDAFGEERIVAAVEETMELLRHGPRLLVRVPTNSYSALRARLETAAQQGAYTGTVVVREDSSLAAGDVSLDWGDGAAAFERESVFARIEDIMNRRLEAASVQESEA